MPCRASGASASGSITLTQQQLIELTDVDHVSHEALGAHDAATGEGVGVARHVRAADDPTRAEFACTVLDRWQRRGVGTALIERLAGRARANGIERFTTRIVVGNEPARRLLAHVADEIGEHREGGTIDITARPRTPAAPAESSTTTPSPEPAENIAERADARKADPRIAAWPGRGARHGVVVLGAIRRGGAPEGALDVLETDAMGAGLRLLPLIGGLMAGLIAATALQAPRKPTDAAERPRVGARAIVALGFAVMAGGLGIGATTAIDSTEGLAATWFVIVGVGLGFALPATMNAALGALSPDRSGVGSALIMALRFVGSTIGVAVLGTILNSGYRHRLDPSGLPSSVAHAAQDSVTAGVAVADKLGSPTLLHSVQTAFVGAMDVMLWVTSGIAIAAMVLALIFLPSGRATGTPTARQTAERGGSKDHELAA